MRSLKKKPDPYGKTSSSTASAAPVRVIKVIPQEKAIDYIKAGNYEGLQEMIAQAGEDISFLNICHTKTGRHPLAVAAEEGRQMETEILIGAKVDINKRDDHGMTALLYAAKNGEPDILKMLVDAGAELTDVHEATQESLLFLAAKHRHINIVKQLIDLGRDVDVLNYRQESPLWNAIKMEEYALASLLLSKDANINLQRPGGDTLLLTCAFNGTNLTQIDFLLNHGAQIQLANDNGITVFMLCARHGHDTLMLKLLEFCKSRDTELAQARATARDYGGHCLEYVTIPNMQDMCYASLIDAQDSGKKTALMYATLHSKKNCVSLLLQYQANPLLQDVWGYTALMFAVRVQYIGAGLAEKERMLEIVDLLINYQYTSKNHGNDNTNNSTTSNIKEEQTHSAAADSSSSIDINAQFLLYDNNYQNALAHACLKDNVVFAEHLVEAGCPYNTANIDEKVPLELLTSAEQKTILSDVITRFARYNKDYNSHNHSEGKVVKPKWIRNLNRDLYGKSS